MEDLKRLAYLYIVPAFHWLYEFGLNVLFGIDVNSYSMNLKSFQFIICQYLISDDIF